MAKLKSLFTWTDVLRVLRAVIGTRDPVWQSAGDLDATEYYEAMASIIIYAEIAHHGATFYWHRRFTMSKPRFVDLDTWEIWVREYRNMGNTLNEDTVVNELDIMRIKLQEILLAGINDIMHDENRKKITLEDINDGLVDLVDKLVITNRLLRQLRAIDIVD